MTSARTLLSIVITSVAFIGLATSAGAQAVDIPALATGTTGPSSWANAGYAHQFETDVDSSSAEMSRHSVQIVAGQRAQASDDVFVLGNLAYNGTYYDFDKGRGPATRLVWDDIHQVTLALGVGWKIDENWTLVGLALGRAAGEGGATVRDTLTGGGAAVIDYKWSDDLSTGIIIGALSQLEDSAALLVVPTVDWSFSEGWLFHFGLVGMTHPGVGPEISWRSDDLQLAFGGSYQTRRYRLDSRSIGSPESKGIGEERSFPIFARASWLPNDNVSLGITGGVAVGGQIRSGTKSGTKILKEDYDPAPFVGVQVGFRF